MFFLSGMNDEMMDTEASEAPVVRTEEIAIVLSHVHTSQTSESQILLKDKFSMS